MSGGPYGRGKAPERACRPLIDWPDQDRQLWVQACSPGDLLEEDFGARARHSAHSNRKAQSGYGRWLTFLTRMDEACLREAPADRITPARVHAYVEFLAGLGNITATLLARLQELGEVARVVGPGRDWAFIRVIASKIRSRHRPSRDKSNLRLSDELLDLGLRLIASASARFGVHAAALHRDGLIIALLALVPLRRRNLAGLRLGHNLLEHGGSWLIALAEHETKTHAPLEMLWPNQLRGPLITYLSTHRACLAAREGLWTRPLDDAVWVSTHGSPMTEIAIYDRIRRHTRDAFGAPMNPHLFRDAASTTLAIADPEHVRAAAPLLGHRTFATTERHYQQAKTLQAHRVYVDTLFNRRKR